MLYLSKAEANNGIGCCSPRFFYVLFILGLLCFGCASIPDYSKHSNAQLTNQYYDTLTELGYYQAIYAPTRGSKSSGSETYNSEKVSNLKARLSAMRTEMVRRGLKPPQ